MRPPANDNARDDLDAARGVIWGVIGGAVVLACLFGGIWLELAHWP